MTTTNSQSLQQCIHLIQKISQNTDQVTERKEIKIITTIVKHFSQYSKDTDTLPPQTLIPCCLFVLPKQFYKLLNVKEGQPLDDIPEKKSLQILLETYLKAMLKLLQQSEDQIKHVIIEGISKSILLAIPYPKIARKWVKQLIIIWSSESNNINLGLRAFIALNKYLRVTNDENFMWALRRIYVSYFQNSKQVSWRNLQHVNFMINCFCEICKINDSRTYYVLFGYIRSIALQIAKLNKTKRKEKVQLTNKLYSNQILNCFRLFSSIVSRVNSQQLSALIYPLVELSVAYERVSQANEFIPLKLHLLNFLLTIMQSTNIIIPAVLEIIEKLLKNKLFLRKLNKRAQKVGGDLELSYKLSPTDLTNTSLINQTFNSIIHKVYWLLNILSKIPGGSQMIKKIFNIFNKLEYSFSGYKILVGQLKKITKQDSYSHYQLRASEHVSLIDDKGINNIEKLLQNKEFLTKQKYQQIKQQREDMLRRKLLAENEDGMDNEDGGQEEIQEDQDEVNSGWQEAESGASEFVDEENEQKDESDSDEEQEEDKQDISYEGDPEPEQADEVIQQWSQQEWSSQNEL